MPTPEELEDRAAKAAVAGLKRRLEEFHRKAAQTWDTLDPSPDLAPRLAGILADQLRQLDTSDLTEPVKKAAAEAVEEGVSDARRRLRLTTPRRRVMAPIDVIRAVMGIQAAAQDELDAAAALLREATGRDGLDDAMARAHRAVTRTERTARWSVNRSLSEGVRAVTEEEQAGRLWVPERDACLRCLAYAGLYVGPGQSFPPGLTFDTKATRQLDPVPDPPLHPNCRCRTIPWREEWGSDYGDSLKREAERSVLRGFSLPSESERARLRAADDLLKRTQLPKSVQDYARRAVKRGEFPRGRGVPVATRALPKRRRPPGTKASPAAKAIAKMTVDPLKGLKKKSGDLSTPLRPALDDDYFGMVTQGPGTGDAERNGDVRFTNPNYYEGRKWQVNCQRVAVAYELRRRGYAVEARPNDKKPGTKQYTYRDLEAVWKGDRQFTPITTIGGDLKRQAENIVRDWPVPSRGWVTANWKAGAAHIWNVEKLPDGRVVWIDAQIRSVLPDGQPHFTNAGSMQIMRVDDLEPTPEQVTMVKNVVVR